MKFLKGSPQQEAIWEFVNNAAPHGLVDAVAGSGKTTTIVEAVKRVPPNISVLIMAFNVVIANHLKAIFAGLNLDNVTISTYNSFGWGILRRAFHSIELNEWKMNDIAKEIVPSQHAYSIGTSVKQIVKFLKYGLLEPTAENIEKIIDTYDIDVFVPLMNKILECVPKVLQACENDTVEADYDDQIWMPVVMELPVSQFDLVFIDEAQDTNPMQQVLAMRAVEDGGRLIVVGDKHQCQPGATLVTLEGGSQKRIDELVVGDKVVSYNRHPGGSKKQHFVGVNTQGRTVTAIKKRHYDGRLINIGIGDLKTQVTPNHRMLVRFNVNRPIYATYLMQKGDNFRVGWCQLFNSNGDNNLAQRARLEDADSAWILGVHSDKASASFEECRIAAEHRIPQVMFKEQANSGLYTQENLNAFWYWANSNLDMPTSAVKVLGLWGRELSYPFWKKGDNGHQGKTKVFECYAANVIPYLMEAASFNETDTPVWESIRTYSTFYNGPVYSLDVDTHHNYVADNILVGNSIYGFRGADFYAIDRMHDALNKTASGCQKLPLTVSRRCPQRHIRLAQTKVPHITALDTAGEGTVNISRPGQIDSLVKPGALFISRVNAPLLPLCYQFLRNGVSARVLGKDEGSRLLQLVNKLNATSIPELRKKLAQWYELKRQLLVELGDKGINRRIALQEKYDCLCALMQEVPDLATFKCSLDTLFDDKNKDKMVTLGTVHRTKGLESHNVVILTPELIPHPMAKTAEAKMQEDNLAYVAVTRSLENLTFEGCMSPAFKE